MSDISITASQVLKSPQSQLQQGVAGVALTAGTVFYIDTNQVAQLSDSNGAAATNAVTGIALNNCGAGQPFDYVAKDALLTLGAGASLVSGNTLWLSDTPGKITQTYADIASGSVVISLGVVNTDGVSFNFNPVVGGTK